MFFELIGTWLVAGFFSAIGWHEADQMIVKPYLTKEKKRRSRKRTGRSNNKRIRQSR